jgi:hypothetical protein
VVRTMLGRPPPIAGSFLTKTNCRDCAVWTSQTILYGPMLSSRRGEKSQRKMVLCLSEKNQSNMIQIDNKPKPKLRKAPQPPLSYPGATPDSDRARKPPLSEPSAIGKELNPGDRVEGLGDFGTPTGEFGTVKRANDDDAIVQWDDDGRVRVHQPLLKKV